MNQDILATARELGEALNETLEVQAYLQADAAYHSSPEIQLLLQQVDEAYNDLITRQRSGEMLLQHEVNAFYHLRDQLTGHPVVVERENRLQAVRALFEQAGSAISSILSVDYTTLAGSN